MEFPLGEGFGENAVQLSEYRYEILGCSAANANPIDSFR
jgi:hypothetical protein